MPLWRQRVKLHGCSSWNICNFSLGCNPEHKSGHNVRPIKEPSCLNENIQPSPVGRLAGMPNMIRRRETGELASVIKRSSTVKCSNCGGFGHNKRICQRGLVVNKKRSTATIGCPSNEAGVRATTPVTKGEMKQMEKAKEQTAVVEQREAESNSITKMLLLCIHVGGGQYQVRKGKGFESGRASSKGQGVT
ncbi:hypothetical protein CFOL_v3_16628 [Cephalotus follicularis]|uniref:CCHC-type domain-containing protein n=1 Tax=Cephalotus follicularis TaxID=3775 RepID=A0A1Q3BZ27_CEPFO|nr:hypothetical protein CFOL_v3_16628 [Cephalotus follicularis]